jgi:hypothetical protein
MITDWTIGIYRVRIETALYPLFADIKTLSTDAAEQIADLRDRIQETLYHVVRESHPKEVASSRFGNILLFLPTIMVSARRNIKSAITPIGCLSPPSSRILSL